MFDSGTFRLESLLIECSCMPPPPYSCCDSDEGVDTQTSYLMTQFMFLKLSKLKYIKM